MHTEEQAKTLWCPMVRHSTGNGSLNRGVEDSNPTNADTPHVEKRWAGRYGCHCIASKCAMWRWNAPVVKPRFIRADDFEATKEPPRPAGMPWFFVFEPTGQAEQEPAGWREPKEYADARNFGYCGLAGKPGEF